MKLLFSAASLFTYAVAIILSVKAISNPTLPGIVIPVIVFSIAKGLSMVRKEMK